MFRVITIGRITVEMDPKDKLSRRRAIGRISALALGAYAAPAFTTLSVARASDSDGNSSSSNGSNTSNTSDGSNTSDVSNGSDASDSSDAGACSSASDGGSCDS